MRKYGLNLCSIPQISECNSRRGFFTTPKWLRDFILILNPTVSETLLNLSMGTGSFLIDSISYIFGNIADDSKFPEQLENARRYIRSNIYA
jgi:hypothetical protein